MNNGKVSRENSKTSWRYQTLLSRKKNAHTHSSPIYGHSVKRIKTINKMSGNIPGGDFPEGFQVGV